MKNKIVSYFNRYDFILFVFSILLSFFIEWKLYPDVGINWGRLCSVNIVVLIIYYVSKILYKKKIDNAIIKKCNNYNINTIFIIICSIFGLVFGFFIPLHEVPDEITHINMIYEERNLNIKFSDVNDGYYGDPDVQLDNFTKLDKNKYFDFSKRINVNNSFAIPSFLIIRHFPQWIAMLIGEVLHLPVFVYLALIEVFSLFFYVFVCNIALKLMPFKKMFFMASMLLPVSIQQMASVSYDVVLIPFCFLFIAYIFNIKYVKKSMKTVDLLLLLLILSIIVMCKIPYIVIGLLLFLIPLDKILFNFYFFKVDGKKLKSFIIGHKILTVIISAVICLILTFVMYKLLYRLSYGRVLIGSFLYFPDTISLINKSLDNFFIYYNDSLFGNLGVFNIKTSLCVELFIYIALILMTFFNFKITNNKESAVELKMSIYDRVILLLTVLILGYVIILSMYPWTLNVSGVPNWDNLSMPEIKNYYHFLPYIGGVQGRYFIPLIPLLYISFGSLRTYRLALKLNPIFYQIAYYSFVFIYFVIVLLLRFWI